MTPENEELNNGTELDKNKYPHGEKEQPIGQWYNPSADEQYVECPIGKSRP